MYKLITVLFCLFANLSSYASSSVITKLGVCKTNFDVGITSDSIKLVKLESELDSLINSTSIADTTQLACLYHQIGNLYFHKVDYNTSLEKYKKSLLPRKNNIDSLLWKSYYLVGVSYFSQDRYKEALKYLSKAKQTIGIKSISFDIEILKYLAECSVRLGSIEEAKNFALQAINYAAKINKVNFEVYVTAAGIFSESNDTSDLNKAINFANKAIEKFSPISELNYPVEVLNTKANAYSGLGKHQKAIDIYKYLLLITDEYDVFDKAKILNNIGSEFMFLGDLEKSIYYIDKSLHLKIKYHKQNRNYGYARNYEHLGDVFFRKGILEKSLSYYQNALINLTNRFKDEDIFQNPNPKDTTLFIYSNPDIIRVLHLKATAAYLYFQKNNEEKYLNLANQTYQTAFNFHDKLQKDISTENSRLFQAKNILSYIENALKVACELHQKGQHIGEAAFRFMEKNKATVLLQSMNEADALQFANLPDSLLNQERDLKIAITFHNKQLNEAIEYEDTTEIERLDKILFEEKQQYSQLITNLENNYPNYYRLKYQQNQTQLKDVQTQLEDNTALLEYFVGDSSIYTLLILKDRTQLFKTKKPADWEEQINHFREAFTLSNREDQFNKYNKKLFKKFVTNANALYQYLLEEPLKELHQISQLKIIPDAELNYIPFDLLLTNAVDTSTVNYKNLPYLLKQKTISYAYSAALMMEQQEADNIGKDFAYGGYAPKYDHSTNSDLPKARELVKTMASFFSGKKHLNKKATKANFLIDSLSYQILHLAMHGKLNDLYPLNSHLVFTKTTAKSVKDDYQLYASDLYLHEINAELTILNACETGTGELQKGEGVMSLSRAFTYAGCPSLMMSLWSIDEQPSAEILETFFKNIKNGSQKNTAIRQAKLDYLDNTKANFSHPYYWAGLVLSGNAEAIHFENSLSGFWWIFIVILVILGGYYTIKK